MGARTYPFDALLLLTDAVAVTASCAGQVSGTAKVVDLYGQRTEAWVVINVASMKVSAGDEGYRLTIQGSNSPTFASGVIPLGSIDLGAAGNSAPGSYEFGICTEQGSTVVRYVRMFLTLSGTSPAIIESAFLARQPA